MKAYRVASNRIITPFHDSVCDVRILDVPLVAIQNKLLEQAGYELVDHPPSDEPYLLISDRVWCTYALLYELKNHQGRVRISDERWKEATHPLQDLEDGAYDLAILPAGAQATFDGVPILEWEANIREGEPLDLHVAIAHASRPICQTPYMIHHIDHWSHIVRVNQLALLNEFEATRYQWKQAGLVGKMMMVLGFLLKIRSISRRKILARIGRIGKNCTIHPTAVIEACTIGDNVEIGPHAVVRASVIASGAKLDEHTVVNLSVVGEKARVGRTAILNLSILYPRAMFSHGNGLQGSVFGQDSFLAIGVTGLDISFGKSIRVHKDSEWVDSGMHFLGVAVGHRAVIGNSVRLNYGVCIPNDALIVGPKEGLFLDATQAPAGEPSIWYEGSARSIQEVRRLRSDRE